METFLQFFRRWPTLRMMSLLAGSLVWLLGFFLLPLAYLFAVSFAARSPYGTIQWALGLHNYTRAFQPLCLEIYWRSFWMALLTTLLCALLGYPVAYTIAPRVPARWKSALLLLVVIPFWTSFLIHTYAGMVLLRTEGVINYVLLNLHRMHEPLRLLYTPAAVFVGRVYGESPFMILPLYAVLQKLDASLLEAAHGPGARIHQLLPPSPSGQRVHQRLRIQFSQPVRRELRRSPAACAAGDFPKPGLARKLRVYARYRSYRYPLRLLLD